MSGTIFGLLALVVLIQAGVVWMRLIPIPTTLLVDADGVVRWIDQASDYAVRSHPERVLAAIRKALG